MNIFVGKILGPFFFPLRALGRCLFDSHILSWHWIGGTFRVRMKIDIRDNSLSALFIGGKI